MASGFTNRGKKLMADVFLRGATNNFGLMYWLKPATIGDVARCVVLGLNGTTDRLFNFVLSGTPRLRFTTANVKDYDFASYTVASGAWVHVAFVMDSADDVTLYIDGVSQGITTHNVPMSGTIDRFRLGNRAGAWYSGAMADFRVYSGAPTQSEILAVIAEAIPSGVAVAPAASAAKAAAVAPTVVRGAISVTPAASAAKALAAAPTVIRGSIAVTPASAIAKAASNAPTVVRGSLGVTPPVAATKAAALAPGIPAGGVTVTATPAAAQVRAVTGSVVHGSLSVTPALARAIARAVAPTIAGGAEPITGWLPVSLPATTTLRRLSRTTRLASLPRTTRTVPVPP